MALRDAMPRNVPHTRNRGGSLALAAFAVCPPDPHRIHTLSTIDAAVELKVGDAAYFPAPSVGIGFSIPARADFGRSEPIISGLAFKGQDSIISRLNSKRKNSLNEIIGALSRGKC